MYVYTLVLIRTRKRKRKRRHIHTIKKKSVLSSVQRGHALSFSFESPSKEGSQDERKRFRPRDKIALTVTKSSLISPSCTNRSINLVEVSLVET